VNGPGGVVRRLRLEWWLVASIILIVAAAGIAGVVTLLALGNISPPP
jgi:hypothetical protein